jgi:two-component system, LytTR family, response regulator
LKIRALIVDDEPLGRERIRTLLREDAEVGVVGEAADGHEATAAVERLKPDLLFLDVQMPEMDGFAVLEAIADKHMPEIIFVTAYDRYAVRAFEVHALDYLLKAFDRERFESAVAHAKEEIRRSREGVFNERLVTLLEDLESRKPRATRLVIKSAGRIFFLAVQEIDWVEAADNYVRIHAAGKEHLMRETLQSLEGRLDPARFLRIHRSTIVNIDRIRELHPMFHGDYALRLCDGTELTLSRNYRNNLGESLARFLWSFPRATQRHSPLLAGPLDPTAVAFCPK